MPPDAPSWCYYFGSGDNMMGVVRDMTERLLMDAGLAVEQVRAAAVVLHRVHR
jgi:hypothetical protein